MTTYDVSNLDLDKLRGRTILITGASSGIGKTLVEIAHGHGANIVIGDWNEKDGQAVADSLKERVVFQKCNVAEWEDQLSLFQTAHDKFGRIDVVYANAGIHEGVSMFDGTLTAPDLKTIDVDLKGAIYTAKLAVHFFGKNPTPGGAFVMTGSAASVIDTPPLHIYCGAKAGLLGYMRSLRTQLPKNYNATVNIILPWMTRTPMLTDHISGIWGDLPANETSDVARALLLPAVRTELNGKAFWVGGGQVIDLEEGIDATRPQWMGEQMSRDVDEGQRRLIP